MTVLSYVLPVAVCVGAGAGVLAALHGVRVDVRGWRLRLPPNAVAYGCAIAGAVLLGWAVARVVP